MKRIILLVTLILLWGYDATAGCTDSYTCEMERRLDQLEWQRQVQRWDRDNEDARQRALELEAYQRRLEREGEWMDHRPQYDDN